MPCKSSLGSGMKTPGWSPALSSTFRCFVIAGRVISSRNGFARSETFVGPWDKRESIARLVGSARA